MRAGASVLLALVLLGASAAPAAADPPDARCTLTDRRLAEASGLVVGPDGPQVVNDSGNPSTVYRLDARCAVAGARAVGVPGRDVEDLARAADGTLWLADIGDNGRSRPTVAILRLPPRGGEIVTPLAYPDGPHDAETLVLPSDGRPVIVTKDLEGRSGVYVTDAPLPASPGASPGASPVALRRAGQVTVPPSDTVGGPVEIFGGSLLTGGAMAPDGRVVALRTYTDAWLYRVAGAPTADAVVAALATPPTRVPLPDEPQGEAVAIDAAGTLYSAGESPSGGPRATLRAVVGAEQRAVSGVDTTPVTTAATGRGAPRVPGWVVVVGVVAGALVLAAGVGLGARLAARIRRG